MQRLAEVGHAAVVVEGEYPDLFRTQPGRGSWMADMLGRLATRYPEVPVIFASSRKFAEEWAYRFDLTPENWSIGCVPQTLDRSIESQALSTGSA